MRRYGCLLAGLCIGLALSGCIQADGVEGSSSPVASPPDAIVVALIDTGINPYHTSFASGASPLIPSAQGVQLSTSGGWDERIASDAMFWDGAETNVLYQFLGTRIAAISFGRSGERPMLDYYPPSGHGTGVASLLARDAPNALIVVVQARVELCSSMDRCLLDPSIADAMEWVAAQEWIDIVSVSVAIPTNTPDPPQIHPEAARYLAASRRAHDDGKLILNGAGNLAIPPLADYMNGTPWIVAVGGWEPVEQGESSGASRFVDVVANYSESVASSTSVSEYLRNDGTSFATPIVAATLASAMSDLRSVTSYDRVQERIALREAMNLSAVRPDAFEWRPADPTNLSRPPLRSIPAASPAQLGWGVIHAGLAAQIGEAASDGKISQSMTQDGYQDIRERYWDGCSATSLC
jgi:hypothetical protein